MKLKRASHNYVKNVNFSTQKSKEKKIVIFRHRCQLRRSLLSSLLWVYIAISLIYIIDFVVCSLFCAVWPDTFAHRVCVCLLCGVFCQWWTFSFYFGRSYRSCRSLVRSFVRSTWVWIIFYPNSALQTHVYNFTIFDKLCKRFNALTNRQT